MCIIAGYAGNKPAAPILIEMLKKTEYIDGGLSTGIATIHEGKLYMRKVIGDVDTLLRETDALSLPGTTGIIHSRTDGNHIAHAHPFLSDDEKMALCANGTSWGGGTPEFFAESNRLMSEFFDKGVRIRSAYKKEDPEKITPTTRVMKNGYNYHVAEPYLQIAYDGIRGLKGEALRQGLAKKTKEALETLPIDVITVSVHEDLADTITIGTVSRPMSFKFGDGEAFMCTAPFGLPEQIQGSVVFLPPTTVAQLTRGRLNIISTSLDDTRVEQIDFRLAMKFRLELEKLLKYGRENAIDLYDIPFYTDWDEIWSKPMVDSKYALENSRLKPVASALYEGLWSFYKEGKLRFELGTRKNKNGTEKKIMKFWLE